MRPRYLVPIFCAFLCGCYESVPIQVSAVQPGTKIRVTLTDAGTDSLARYLGPGVLTGGWQAHQRNRTRSSLSA